MLYENTEINLQKCNFGNRRHRPHCSDLNPAEIGSGLYDDCMTELPVSLNCTQLSEATEMRLIDDFNR